MTVHKRYGVHSLRFRLVLASTLVEIVMLGALVWNSTRIADQVLIRDFQSRTELLLPLLNASIAPPLAERDYSTLEDLLEKIVQQHSIVYIDISDVRKRHIISRGPVPPNDVLDESVRHADSIFDQALDVKIGGSVVGRVRYGIDISTLDVTVDQLRWQGLFIAAVEVILTFSLLALLGYFLTRHLRMLSDAARNMEQGDYENYLPEGGSDEVADTARAFNTMARAVEYSLRTLKENQALLKAITDNSAAVIYVKDLDGRFMFVNREFERLFGVSGARLKGESSYGFLPKDTADVMRDNDIAVIEQKTALQFEEKVPLPDGSHRYLSVKFPLLDESGQVYAIAGISTDITERKRAERWREGQNKTLSLMVSNAGLNAALEALVEMLESENDGATGSVLLLDPEGTHLRFGAGRNLPAAVARVLDGSVIEPAAGACGIAVHDRRVVVVEDIQADPLWANHREVAGRYNLRACWSQPICSADGSVLGIVALYFSKPCRPGEHQLSTLRDAGRLAVLAIESERTRSQLVASEQRFRATFEQAAVGMAQTSPDGRWLRVNQKLCDITGYTRDELLARGFRDITHPDDISIDLENMQRLLSGSMSAYSREKRYIRKDGTAVWIHITVALVRTYTGAPDYFITVLEDISVRKQAVEELKNSERFFRNVLDSLSVMAGTLSPQGILLFANKTALTAGGVTPDEVFNKPLVDTPWFSWSKLVQLRLGESIRRAVDGATVHYEDQLRMQDGQFIDVEILIVPVSNAQGAITHIVVSGFDITGRKRAAAEIHTLNTELERRVHERTMQLAAANKELEAFAYSVSHDLRAPLRAIDGFSQALIEDCAPSLDASSKIYLERVRAATQRMGVLIDDLLLMSRVTRQEMIRENVNLSAHVKEILADLAQREPQRQVEVVIAPGSYTSGDARLLRVMLDNLLDNAWKYTSKTAIARIEYGYRLEEEEQIHFVRDNGAGFDMRYAGKLFGAFQRMHKTEDFPGTGVGLATAARIIYRHGGRIWAEAEVNKGATFYFTLPLAANMP